MNAVDETINKVVDQLKSTTDEETIREIVTSAWIKLKAEVANENTFKRKVRTPLRKAIEEAFPSKNVEEPKPKGYYQTNAGKNKDSRWEHLAIWYATTNEDRWNIVGDGARAEYWGNLPAIADKPVEAKQLEQDQLTKFKLEDMTVDQLELDAETQQVVNSALNHSGMNLTDFIKQACTVYAKTVMGKAKQSSDDLSTVPTEELLNVSQMVDGKEVRSKYFTHPKRAEELTRRAIEAIKRHNANAPEKTQRWAITQTAIQFLTGSRPATIKEILKQYQTDIEDHHRSYELSTFNEVKNEYTLDRMINRKGKDVKIEEEINFVKLVPDGL